MYKKSLSTGRVLICVLSLSLSFLIGCKKESVSIEGNKQLVENSRQWYEAQQKNLDSRIKSSTGTTNQLIFKPDWDLVKVDKSGDATIITTLVNTNLSNIDNGQTQYNLVIKYDGNHFESKVVTVPIDKAKSSNRMNPKELYELSFLEITDKENIKRRSANVYSNRFVLERQDENSFTRKFNDKLQALNSKDLVKLKVTVCMDLFLTTDWYTNGVYQNTSTVFVGSHCSDVMATEVWWIANDDGTYHAGTRYQNVDSRDTNEMKAFEEDYKSRMSSRELGIYNSMTRTNQLSYLANAKNALDETQTRFAGEPMTDSKADAFRHAYFSMLNVDALGLALAESLGTAHEDGGNNSALAKQMDLYNNAIGRSAHQPVNINQPGYWSIYANIANSLLVNGNLKYILYGQLCPTNM
ncbi:hypothetical protein [Pedobacter sp. Leaf170]|uniref:DUF6973 domain-containing protein n=1 Tax=Pedobacter sp. Leaf170 TaxID=2876558 RepID=UPI001E2F285E|nr:hypothetical protein [Pedobacter sp. Leaf170]